MSSWGMFTATCGYHKKDLIRTEDLRDVVYERAPEDVPEEHERAWSVDASDFACPEYATLRALKLKEMGLTELDDETGCIDFVDWEAEETELCHNSWYLVHHVDLDKE